MLRMSDSVSLPPYRRVFVVLHQPDDLVPGEAQSHEDEQRLGAEQTRLVGAKEGELPQGGTEEGTPIPGGEKHRVDTLNFELKLWLYGTFK